MPNARQHRYYRKHKEKILAAQKYRYNENRIEISERRKKKYREEGLSEAEIERRIEYRRSSVENGTAKAYQKRRREKAAGRPMPDLCEACGFPPPEGKLLHFDHCHTFGHFRGWLCPRCNWVLGLVEDDRKILKALSRYLRERDK